jgi:adenine-specific DNA-methyltransferase
MPTLHWIGKDKVINHHHDVPFKVLDHQYTFNGNSAPVSGTSPNKIIHGDNLEALKALLPQYEGKIKCIYIDPPYNTGNENWVYNDNVSDPRLKKWLGQVVGKDSEDLTRHDKWLCMMYPRLVLLHKLLAKDGAIFISIDDNEHVNLKMICDEIFGKSNYLTSLVWRRRASSQMSQNNVSVDHEYVVAYFKSDDSKFYGLKKDYKNYSNKDSDPKGLWTLGDLTVGMTKDQRPNQFYDLIDPYTNIVYKANPKRVWTYAPETMKEKLSEGRIVFPKTENGRPMFKRYLTDLKSEINPLSSWVSNESYAIGLNSEGTKIIQSLFEDKVFDYPKPLSLFSNSETRKTSIC